MFLYATKSVTKKGDSAKNSPHPESHFTSKSSLYSETHHDSQGGHIATVLTGKSVGISPQGGDIGISPIWDTNAEPVGDWILLLTWWCDRRDKPRLRECLDGLKADSTLDETQRREVWKGLTPEQRAMCKAIAGGEANG